MNNSKAYEAGGIAFIGCIIAFTGLGVIAGALTGNWMYVAATALLGTGVGFIVMGLLIYKAAQKK